jgi:hypothetical protein
VLHAQGGGVWFSALGLTRVLWGTATVECSNEKITKHLTDGQQYDVVTGDIGLMDKELKRDLMLHPDPLPPELQKPRFQVPHRSF